MKFVKPDRMDKTVLVSGLRHEPLILIFLLIGLWLLAACAPALSETSTSPTPTSTEVEPTATPGPVMELEVKDLHGNPVRLSDYRGKAALVTFWASWCTPCKEELPLLEAFYQEHQEEGFVLIGVNAGEGPEDAARYIAAHGFTFLAWSDPAGTEMIRIGARGLPYSFLVDQEGRRKIAWYGGANEAFLDELWEIASSK